MCVSAMPARISGGVILVALLVVCPNFVGARRLPLSVNNITAAVRDFVMQPQSAIIGSLVEALVADASNAPSNAPSNESSNESSLISQTSVTNASQTKRMQPLFANVAEDWTDEPPVEPEVTEPEVVVRSTTAGCACKRSWTLAGHERCRDFCCNPDEDAGGEWCFADDDFCQGAGWGYCAPKGTELEHGYRPGFPDIVAAQGEPGVSRVLAALGGGTGVRVGGLRHNELDRELLRRMRIQDKAVALAIVALYFAFLAFGFSAKFHDSYNDSPVTYYADPRYHSLVSEGNDADSFLDAFNQAPKNVHLQVTGFLPVSEGRGSVQWKGDHYRVAFAFALDLSPWVTRALGWPDPARGSDARLPAQPLRDGVVPEDYVVLSNALNRDKNQLAIIEVQKEVDWPGCEELATNIKLKIRQMGFAGVIGINLSEGETVSVFKNAPWANFLHSRTTKVLVVLSIFGWILYFPYMWLRCRATRIRARYRVDVSIGSYWPLIADKLTANGFDSA